MVQIWCRFMWFWDLGPRFRINSYGPWAQTIWIHMVLGLSVAIPYESIWAWSSQTRLHNNSYGFGRPKSRFHMNSHVALGPITVVVIIVSISIVIVAVARCIGLPIDWAAYLLSYILPHWIDDVFLCLFDCLFMHSGFYLVVYWIRLNLNMFGSRWLEFAASEIDTDWLLWNIEVWKLGVWGFVGLKFHFVDIL